MPGGSLSKKEIGKIISPILEKLVNRLLVIKPDDPIPYMVQYLEDSKGYGAKPLSKKEAEELARLRRQFESLKAKAGPEAQDEDAKISDEDHSEDDEDDYIDDLPEVAKNRMSGPARTSVSAEAFGVYHKKEDFTARVIPKPEETKQKIRNRLLESFLFSNLDEKDLVIVIDAMEEKIFEEGQTVIQQGDDGAELFLVGEGTLECFRVMKKGEEPTKLKEYEHGEAFGELALLYNAPRAATITAKTKSVLYSLDRDTFNLIVKDAARKKREKYEDSIKRVKILDSVSAYERSQITDAIKEEHYKPGEKIISEGETGDVFYMISEGEAVATKVLEDGTEPKEVMKYSPGDYFGELALLRNEPRAANVVAKTDLTVMTLDRNSFRRMIGPLDEILKRNMEMYKNVVTS
jgi:cAMP-dependent protein kinase regulator